VGLKQKLSDGVPVLGTFIKTPHPHVVEVLATAGLDCVVLDAEHAPFDRRDIDLCILAGRANGLQVLVRVPSNDEAHILNALDCGADGVVVPHVRNMKEAHALVRVCHYGPEGRGFSGSSRAASYGGKSVADHLSDSAASIIVIAQIEDAEALDEIDAISSVNGIDALFVGIYDLTISLSCQSPDDPKVVAAVDYIVQASVKADRSVGMFLPNSAKMSDWRSKGITFFLVGSDQGFVRAGAQALSAAGDI
jgi:staphyloferrin B biosynthesis citrate synthase